MPERDFVEVSDVSLQLYCWMNFGYSNIVSVIDPYVHLDSIVYEKKAKEISVYGMWCIVK